LKTDKRLLDPPPQLLEAGHRGPLIRYANAARQLRRRQRSCLRQRRPCGTRHGGEYKTLQPCAPPSSALVASPGDAAGLPSGFQGAVMPHE
jgi:hypothetical protein